jgi:hypothetical protein
VNTWAPLALAPPALAGAGFFYLAARRAFGAMRYLSVPVVPEPQQLPSAGPRTVPDSALLWKEAEQAKLLHVVPHWLTWTILGGVCQFALLHAVATEPGIRDMAHGFTVALYLFMIAAVCVSTAIKASAAVARERHTLESMLLLPVERRRLLFCKWLAIWDTDWRLLVAILVTPIVALAVGMFSPLSAVLLVLLPLPVLQLVSTLGLFLSVVCRRVAAANVVLVAVLAALVLAHLAIWDQMQFIARGYCNLFLGEHGCPMSRAEHARAVWLILGQQGICILLAAIFAGLAFWRFERFTTESRSQAA